MLPVMAAGLSSIIFSISVDATYLNNPSRSVEVPSVEVPTQVPVSAAELAPISIPSVVNPTLPNADHLHESYPSPLLHKTGQYQLVTGLSVS